MFRTNPKRSNFRVFYDEGAAEGGDPSGDTGNSSGGTGDPTPTPGGGGLPDGAFMADNFREALPEDIRENPTLKGMANLEGMARQLLSLQTMVGVPADQVMRRPATGDNNAMLAVMRQLGAPETVDKFTLPEPPKGVTPNKEFMDSFLDGAVKAGMLPEHVNFAVDFMFKSLGANADATNTAKATQVAEWQGSVSKMFNAEKDSVAWNERMTAAASVFDKFGGDELFDLFDDTGIGDHPAIVALGDKLASVLAGGTLEGTGGEGMGSAQAGRVAELNRTLATVQQQMSDALDNQNSSVAKQMSIQASEIRAEIDRLGKRA